MNHDREQELPPYPMPDIESKLTEHHGILAPEILEDQEIKAGVVHALQTIWNRFDNPQSDERKYYHTLQHSLDVIRRTVLIMQAMGSTIEEVRRAVLYSAFHDIVQSAGPRLNEVESANELVTWMNEHGLGDFVEEARISILLTAGEFEDGGFVQTDLRTAIAKGSPLPLTGIGLALSDLASYGMERNDVLERESLELYLEKNPHHPPDEPLPETWIQRQKRFKEHRKDSLEQELLVVPEDHRNAVRNLYINFSV